MNVVSKKAQAHVQSSDILVVPVFEAKKLTGLAALLDKKMKGWLKQSAREGDFEGKLGQTVMVHAHDTVKPNRVMLVGVGAKKEATLESVRRAAGTAVSAANTLKVKTVAAALSDVVGKFTAEDVAHAFAEGAQLANYAFAKYKEKEAAQVSQLTIVDSTDSRMSAITKGVKLAKITTAATMFSRDLVNEPAIEMVPSALAAVAQKIGKQTGVTTKVYNEKWLREKKMGAILSVAAGSDEAPYFVHMKYTPPRKAKKSIAICGKGITFDSGGISLKPSNYMENMKMDMAGAASVLGLFSQISKLKPDLEVHGVFAAAENMPSGKAIRPGDVVSSYSGKTIEILNTDAEGRMILSDTLTWTEKTLKPDMIIDIATLTGAAIIALGQEVAAVFGSDDKFTKTYLQAAEDAGESHWQLPLVEEYRELLNSQIADCNNSPKTFWAGAILGAVFLQQFVEKTPWMHVDIAGPAWAEKQMLPYVPVGATGFGVRTLITLLKKLS